jgi:excisionase family DNA binding protein
MTERGIVDNKLYTVEEVADFAHVGKRTVWRWIKAGKIPTRRIGRRYLFFGRDITTRLAQRDDLDEKDVSG